MFDNIKRGDIFYCSIEGGVGSEQSGVRPCVVIQNNLGNRFSPNIIVAAVTSQTQRNKLPTHVEINTDGDIEGLHSNSVVLCEQVRTISKQRILDYVGRVSVSDIRKINQALNISVGSSGSKEQGVIDLSSELLIKEKMLIDSVKENTPVHTIKYLAKKYIESLLILEKMCADIHMDMYAYYTPTMEVGCIVIKHNNMLQMTMDLDKCMR